MPCLLVGVTQGCQSCTRLASKQRGRELSGCSHEKPWVGEKAEGRRAGKRGYIANLSPEWERKLRVKILIADLTDSLT